MAARTSHRGTAPTPPTGSPRAWPERPRIVLPRTSCTPARSTHERQPRLDPDRVGGLDRCRAHGRGHGHPPGQGRHQGHGLEPHPGQGRAARRVRLLDRRQHRRTAWHGRRLHDGVHQQGPRAGAARRRWSAGRAGRGAPDRRRLLDGRPVGLRGDARRLCRARRRLPGLPGQRQRQGREGGHAHPGRLGAGGHLPPGAAAAGADRPVGHLRRRGRRLPAGEDLSQHHAGRGHPVHGRDHRAGREGRGLPRGLPRVPQQQRHGLGVHPVQVAGVREPGLHAHVHPDPAAQGLRPRLCGGARPRRPDARGGRGGRGGAGQRQQRPGGGGLLRPARPAGPELRDHAAPRERRGRRRPERGRPMTGARPMAAPGHMGVDYETRVNFDRLRSYRLSRAKESLEASGCGAFLLFDFYNIRYTTQTWIGGALGDKMTRYALLTRGGEPMLWDFGSAARHHRLYSPWLDPENCHAGMLGLRGAIAPTAGLMESAVRQIKGLLEDAGVADAPVAVDIVEPPFLFEMQRQGLTVVDAQQLMLDARQIKSSDEIMLLTQAAAMVDGVYQDIVEVLKPGIRENEIVALANKRLYELGSDQVEAVNAVSGERCNPHPHNFSDRLIRPGDQAFFDIIHSFNGYRTCYYRTFSVGSATAAQRDAYTKAREWMDASINMIKPGVGTDEVAAVWPAATEFGFENEMAAFGLQFGHGLGLGLHERPIISRLNSMTEPIELQPGMVFALETYCPASDGFSAARIEEEVVVTPDGPQILTLFPAQDLVVTNPY